MAACGARTSRTLVKTERKKRSASVISISRYVADQSFPEFLGRSPV